MQQAQNLVAEAEAGIRAARAEIDVAKNVIVQRQFDAASAKAAADEAVSRYARDKSLFLTKGISAPELSASEAAATKFRADAQAKDAEIAIARTEVLVKEGKVAQAEAVLRTARGKVDAAQIGLEKARLTLSLTKITSPIDGVVTTHNRNPGNVVRTAESGGQLPILTVQRIDPVRVIVKMPEDEIPNTEIGAEVELSFPFLPDVPFKGQRIARTGFAVDPKTATMRVEIDVANPQQQLRPGMSGTATVHLRKGPDNALRVPTQAVVWQSADGAVAPGLMPGGGPGGLRPGGSNGPGAPGGAGPGAAMARGLEPAVYVIRGGKAHLVRVQIGLSNHAETEILSGIGADDLVVSDPSQLKVTAVPVEVKPAPAAK